MRTGFVGGGLGYHLLRYLGREVARQASSDGALGSKVESRFGPAVWTTVAGKAVIDFGCGVGTEAVEIARRGARRVIGIDIRPRVLERARLAAEVAGVSDRCVFATHTHERADVVVSIDGFEHYADPEQVLRLMRERVEPTGRVLISFGPPWLHPLGGHLFSVFPWAHLIFTEKALVSWRADFKSDGATRFCEVEGGLNQMTVRRFKNLLERSEFEIESFEAVPIRRLRRLSSPLTREFVTSVVRCELLPRPTRDEKPQRRPGPLSASVARSR